jgi:hypothetical protein
MGIGRSKPDLTKCCTPVKSDSLPNSVSPVNTEAQAQDIVVKPSAESILAEQGAEGLTAYLEANPQSPKRIQDEMRNISLLGGAYNVDGAATA